MPNVLMLAILMVLGYIIGSIPFGVVVSRLLGTTDPRTAGSRNVGFTNVLRVGGKQAGILTLLGDMGKGWFVAWIAGHLLHDEAAILSVAFSVIVGHLHSFFLGFTGGKGVATAFGAVLGLHLFIGLSLLGFWLLAVGLWRYSSGGALTAFGLFPIVAFWFHQSLLFIGFACVVSALIWMRHKENLVRLWSGTESRIGRSGKS
jgi:glycerol-3-phosphate acyltransferase PlsY